MVCLLCFSTNHKLAQLLAGLEHYGHSSSVDNNRETIYYRGPDCQFYYISSVSIFIIIVDNHKKITNQALTVE